MQRTDTPQQLVAQNHTPTGAQPAIGVAAETPGPIQVPVAGVLLPLMAYSNLWVLSRVPGLDWFEQTLPRVLTTILIVLYFGMLWLAGPARRRRSVQRLRRYTTLVVLAVVGLNVLLPTTLFIRDRLARGPYPENVIDWPLQIEAGSTLVGQGKSPYA